MRDCAREALKTYEDKKKVFEERECPFVNDYYCGKTAELLTGRDGLRGRGCFAVIAATYEWAKNQKFAKVVKNIKGKHSFPYFYFREAKRNESRNCDAAVGMLLVLLASLVF